MSVITYKIQGKENEDTYKLTIGIFTEYIKFQISVVNSKRKYKSVIKEIKSIYNESNNSKPIKEILEEAEKVVHLEVEI